MIQFFSTVNRKGRPTLMILTTEAQDRASLIAKSMAVPALTEIQFDSVTIEKIRQQPMDSGAMPAEPLFADAIARRVPWTLHGEDGASLGAGDGEWNGWWCQSPLVDNGVVALQVLHRLEENVRYGKVVVTEAP